jgi:hypothetical protein
MNVAIACIFVYDLCYRITLRLGGRGIFRPRPLKDYFEAHLQLFL